MSNHILLSCTIENDRYEKIIGTCVVINRKRSQYVRVNDLVERHIRISSCALCRVWKTYYIGIINGTNHVFTAIAGRLAPVAVVAIVFERARQ